MNRAQLIEKLTAWQNGQASALEIWQWAEAEKSATTQLADALVRDLLDLLAAIPYEMIMPEDCAVFLDALANPLDETDLSVNLLWNHMDMIDADTRRIQAAGDPFYGQFAELD